MLEMVDIFHMLEMVVSTTTIIHSSMKIVTWLRQKAWPGSEMGMG